MSGRKATPPRVQLGSPRVAARVVGKAGVLLYLRCSSAGLVAPENLDGLRTMMRFLASGRPADLRTAEYWAERCGVELELLP